MSGRSITIVCCHAIWLGGPTLGHDAAEWMLEPFQAGEHTIFRQHVKMGIQCAREECGELWFSGGPTKMPRTERSEGESYLALANSILASELGPATRDNGTHDPFTLHADVFATDSFQNILFPLLQSHARASSSVSSSHVSKINVIGHGFKEPRFLELHLPTLGFSRDWIRSNVRYAGSHVVGGQEVEEGEARAVKAWRECPWGDEGQLMEKRQTRGWKKGAEGALAGLLEKQGSCKEAKWMVGVLKGERMDVAGKIADKLPSTSST